MRDPELDKAIDDIEEDIKDLSSQKFFVNIDSYHQIGHNVELDNSSAGEVLAGISLIFG